VYEENKYDYIDLEDKRENSYEEMDKSQMPNVYGKSFNTTQLKITLFTYDSKVHCFL